MPMRVVRNIYAGRGVIIAVLVAAAIIALPLWWPIAFPRHDPPPPFRYTGLPWKVTTPVVRAGDPPEFLIGRCNDTAEPVTYLISRSFKEQETGREYPLPAVGASMDPGCRQDRSQGHSTPRDLPPGRYYLSVVASGQQDGREWSAPATSETFEVTAP